MCYQMIDMIVLLTKHYINLICKCLIYMIFDMLISVQLEHLGAQSRILFGPKFSLRWSGSFIETFSLRCKFILFYSCHSRPHTKAIYAIVCITEIWVLIAESVPCSLSAPRQSPSSKEKALLAHFCDVMLS